MRRIDRIIIHRLDLSETPYPNSLEGAKSFFGSQNWTAPAYHLLIQPDGSWQQWARLDQVAHHTRGHNRSSVGVAMWDRYHEQPAPHEHLLHAAYLVRMLMQRLDLTRVYGHGELQVGKDCPGFSMDDFRGLVHGLKMPPKPAELLAGLFV